MKFSLGLDVSKRTVEACLLSSEGKRERYKFANCLVGFHQLGAWLHGLNVSELHVCLEPTGKYSRALAVFLHTAGFRVSQVNSFTVLHWGRGKSLRSKNDRIDAYLLADYALKENPPLWSPPEHSFAALREIQARIAQIDECVRQEENRLESGCDLDLIRQDIEEHLVQLGLKKKKLEHAAKEFVRTDPVMSHQYEILKSIVGIGDTSSRVLLAFVSFSKFSESRKVASFAGLTPSQYQSGTSINRHQRLSRRGNQDLRKALYFPAISAIQHNPQMREFAERLKERGKPAKVVICAVMRKLLVLAATLLRKDVFYDPAYKPA